MLKGDEFLSFAKNMGTHLSNIYIVKNVLILLKNVQQMQLKTASKRATQETVGPTGDLIGNKIVDKKQMFLKNLQWNCLQQSFTPENYKIIKLMMK